MQYTINNPMDRAGALRTIRMLRYLADTLERYGPLAYGSGGMLVQKHDETVPMAYDENQRAIGSSAYLGSDLSVECNMVFRVPVHAPLKGLQPILYRGQLYMWDGEPARAVRAGETYNGTRDAHEEQADLSTATRDLKKVRFIYTPC